MKKFFSLFLLFCILPVIQIPAQATLVKKDYIFPLRTTAPNIDGYGDDPQWIGAKELSLASDVCLQEGGYTQFVEQHAGATADISAVWSNQPGKEGLYFKWEVDDPTQSFAVDVMSNQFNSMDCVQIVIDPLHKQYATARNCAMCFTFVPYTSVSGNGSVPSDPAMWWEHWLWAGTISNAGVIVTAQLDKIPDTIGNRVWLVFGYTIEAYIPWKALKINEEMPKGEIGESFGIGFILVDYAFDEQNYSPEHPESSQILINMSTDFGNGKNRFHSPKYYNTAYLGTTDGTLPEQLRKPTLTQDNALAFQALQTEIENAKNNYLNNNEYTDITLNGLKSALQKAETMSTQNTAAELVEARDQLADAISFLIRKWQDELDTYILKALSLDEQKYTPESWALLQEALQAAQQNQPDVETRKNNLAAAFTQLQLLPIEQSMETDRLLGELDAFISSTKNYREQDYEESSWQTFINARTKATEALKADGISIEYLTECLTDLENANASLIKKQENEIVQTTSLPYIIIPIAIICLLAAGISIMLHWRTKQKIKK